jgi:hemerythrin-like domain-containing protein
MDMEVKIMDWFRIMLEEHMIVLETIDALKRCTLKMENGGKLPPGIMNDILDVITTFADKCHHGKEEDVLFPLLAKKPVKDKMMVDILLKEHVQGREYVKMMKSGKQEEIVKGAHGYTELLLKHIFKENRFFKECDALLTEKERKFLFDGFERIELEVMGKGKHEYYHKKAEEIAKKAKTIG